jgi:hypothetical protein
MIAQNFVLFRIRKTGHQNYVVVDIIWPRIGRSSLCFGDFSEVGPVLGVIDEIPLLVLGHLISLSTVSCVLHARFTRSASKLTCFLFVPVVCFLVDVQ